MNQVLEKPMDRMVVPYELELIQKLSKDLKKTATNLGRTEARNLVDLYYQMQNLRIGTEGQLRAIHQSGLNEPNETLKYFNSGFDQLEQNLQKVLDVYTKSTPVGKWLRSINGVGPVIAAGLLANLEVNERTTAGHFWSYCGLNDYNRPWLGREKTKAIVDEVLGDKKNKDITYEDFAECCRRTKWKAHNVIKAVNGKKEPIFIDGDKYKFTKEDIIKQLSKKPYNSRMKTLCWKLAQSFVKGQNNPNDIYGKLYIERKAYENELNEKLAYKDQAAIGAQRVGKTTEAYKWYSKGMLPPAHINRRAERWATRIFLSHLHQVMYMVELGQLPPKPFAEAHLEHIHMIECPNLDLVMAG